MELRPGIAVIISGCLRRCAVRYTIRLRRLRLSYKGLLTGYPRKERFLR